MKIPREMSIMGVKMWMAKSANMNESIKACGMCGQVCIVNRWMQYWLVSVEMSNVTVKLFNSNMVIMGSYLAFYVFVTAYARIMCRNSLFLYNYYIIKWLGTSSANNHTSVWACSRGIGRGGGKSHS